MKKLIALLLCCVLVSVPFTSAVQLSHDTSPVPAKVISYSMNEYELLKSLSTESNDALCQMGYTDNQISKINNLRSAYADHLEEISHYDRAALENLGYTEAQINTLKNFNGSENQIMALAATLNLDLSIAYVTWSESANRTNARLDFSFEWSGVPLIKVADFLAISWNDWTINTKNAYVTYIPTNGTGISVTRAATYVANSGPTSMGAGFKFPMQINDTAQWAESGYGTVTLYHNYVRKDLSAYAEYGHFTIGVSPSFYIPGYGSIVFEGGLNGVAEAWADKTCSN